MSAGQNNYSTCLLNNSSLYFCIFHNNLRCHHWAVGSAGSAEIPRGAQPRFTGFSLALLYSGVIRLCSTWSFNVASLSFLLFVSVQAFPAGSSSLAKINVLFLWAEYCTVGIEYIPHTLQPWANNLWRSIFMTNVQTTRRSHTYYR